jgi:hypothetical protein
MPDPKPPRDKNQPLPKDPPRSSAGATLVKLVLVVALFVGVASVGLYSKEIGTPPWAWTQENLQGYALFMQGKATEAKARVEEIDWANAKTRFTDETKKLWGEAGDVAKRIEEKLGARKAAPAPGTAPAGATPDKNAPAPDTLSPERAAGLEAMRDGIGHYRKSPEDPAELTLAKKKFEEAQGHFEKSLKEPGDDKARADTAQDLRDCNRYLEDCRSREKA